MKLTPKQDEARDVLNGQSKHVLLFGGSRSGKTYVIIRNLILRSLKTKSRHAILRKHFNHVKQSIWFDTFPKVIEQCFGPIKDKLKWNQSDWFVQFPNGSEIWIGGLDDKERTEKILGKEFSTIFFNECSEISYESRNIALTRLAEKNSLKKRIYYDCNPPKTTHWTYSLFIEGLDPTTREKVDSGEYSALKLNPQDNLDNIDPEYIKELQKLPPLLMQRFLLGEFGSDGADIFKSEWLMPSNPKPRMEELAAIFAFCDPAITEKEMSSDNSCESGIVVLGVDYNRLIHDIEVQHGLYGYQELKSRLKDVYERYKANLSFFMGYEKVAFQKALGSDLTAMGIPNMDIMPDNDKVRRAIAVTDLMAEGRCRVNDLELRRQLLGFPTGRLKDLTDAYVYALRMVKSFSEETYEKQTDRYKGLDGRSKEFWKNHFEEMEGTDVADDLMHMING